MHLVQFYADDGFLLDTLAQYIGGALGKGDTGIVIATPEHREGLTKRLLERGIKAESHAAEGRYFAVDARETLARFTVDGMPHATRFAITMGELLTRAKASSQGRLAIYGEMVALLWGQGQQEAAMQLERFWNELGKSQSFTLRCAYPLSVFSSQSEIDAVLRICSEHTHVIPPEEYSQREHGLRGLLGRQS
jgi:hypothetical protein